MEKLKVGILGATGAVGQKFVELLADHPSLEIAALAASERSAGKSYRDAANWIGSRAMPERVAEMEVVPCEPGFDVDFVFSGLDSSVATDIEAAFARAGYPVISNARNYRMDESVPLLIPEVNPDHTELVRQQDWGGSGGFIVTNPNCSTVGLVCALKPLIDAFEVESLQVVTMQALSGAGYPGVASLDAVGNVVPFIDGEEEKISSEPKKLFGQLRNGRIEPATLKISAQCNRVPVINGHLETVSVRFAQPVSPGEVREALLNFQSPVADLPSAPDRFIAVFDDPRFPQPRRHAELGRGMTVSVGRIRPCEVFDVKFVTLVHNTVRGAAGGAILNAELLQRQGFLGVREAATAVVA